MLGEVRSISVKRLITMITYLANYIVQLFIHIYVSKVSSLARSDLMKAEGSYCPGAGPNNKPDQYYARLLSLQIVSISLTVISWCILIQNTSTQTSSLGIYRVFGSVSTNLFEDELDMDETAN